MAKSYTTPGVYIEEVPQFPPSITVGETAVPAFIGYTEKADLTSGSNLHLTPTHIHSMSEYELLYGKAPEEELTLHYTQQTRTGQWFESLQPASCFISPKFCLYYAVQAYFINGAEAVMLFHAVCGSTTKTLLPSPI